MKKWMIFAILLVLLCFSTLPVYAYSNERLNWGFKRSTNHVKPEVGAKFEALLKKYDSVYVGNPSKKEIYLTFDNGYENGFTGSILDTLKEKKVPATFFVTGHYITDQADLVKRMFNEGHIVGNHSWHHPDFTKISNARMKEELTKIKNEYTRLTGDKEMSYLRVPRGVFSERSLAISKELGYHNVFWSLAFIDWHTDKQKGWKYAYDNIMKQIHPGAILLLHSVSKDNADALSKVIDDLRKEGYTFKSLDDLFSKTEFPDPMLKSL